MDAVLVTKSNSSPANPDTNGINILLEQIRLHLVDQLAARDILKEQLAEVQRLGWTEAKPYWRDGRFLILVHPMKGGERKREYVGADPEKVNEALASIARLDEYNRLTDQIAEIEKRLERTKRNLYEALVNLEISPLIAFECTQDLW